MIVRHCRIGPLAALLLLLLLSAAPVSYGQGAGSDLEYKVKAGFLLNFAKFMAWPESAFMDDAAPLVIGVIGENPFGGALEDAESKTVQGRPVKLLEVRSVPEALYCHLLYVSRSEAGAYADLLLALGNRPVVTVSDIAGFTAGQGMVEFVSSDGRLNFIINRTRARISGIEVHATLLTLAVEVL